MGRSTKLCLWMASLSILICIPHLAGVYYANILINLGIVALFAVSYNLLLGYTGLLSFGHAIFFGAGGYATALGLSHIKGISLTLAFGMGIAAAIALAAILSPLVARLKAAAFAMLHLAFNYIGYVVVLKLRGVTGGEDGISGYDIPPLGFGLFTMDMSNPVIFFYFAAFILCASVWLARFFTKTPFGQVMIGIRENDMRIGFLGFEIIYAKAVVYIVAAGLAGVAGSLYAIFQGMIAPTGSVDLAHAFQPILATIVGGAGTFLGPIAGAAILAALGEFTSRFTERVELVNGIVLGLVVLFFPSGFMGLVKKIGAALAKIIKKKS